MSEPWEAWKDKESLFYESTWEERAWPANITEHMHADRQYTLLFQTTVGPVSCYRKVVWTQSLYYCAWYTFVNLDFNTSMASTTILLKNSFSVSKSQCHNTVRRERSTNAWRVTLEGSSSFRNIVYTLCRRFNCVACGLLRKRDKVTCFEQVFYILVITNYKIIKDPIVHGGRR